MTQASFGFHEFVDIILAILLHILWVWNWCKLGISHILINKVNMGAGGCPKLSITLIVMLFLRILKISSFSFLLAALRKKKYIYILVDDLYFRVFFLNIEMFGSSYLLSETLFTQISMYFGQTHSIFNTLYMKTENNSRSFQLFVLLS